MSHAEHRSYSSGHDRFRLTGYLDLLQHYRKNRQFATRHFDIFSKVRGAFAAYGHVPVTDADVLELGCGQRFPLTLLFHSVGARAVGIDFDHVEARPSLQGFRSMLNRNGLERTVKTLIRSAVFDPAYYRTLRELLGRPLRFSGTDLRTMDATALTFADRAFDYVCSSDVFEHISDVEAATREMHRVMRPGGVAYVGINVFSGISGGHHLSWAEPDTSPSKTVPPWDHLRENRFPSQSYLNRVRERDYLGAFGRYFQTLEVRSVQQGQSQLTDEILGELADYSREELLQGGLTVILRRL